jgi:hypothetical protein
MRIPRPGMRHNHGEAPRRGIPGNRRMQDGEFADERSRSGATHSRDACRDAAPGRFHCGLVRASHRGRSSDGLHLRCRPRNRVRGCRAGTACLAIASDSSAETRTRSGPRRGGQYTPRTGPAGTGGALRRRVALSFRLARAHDATFVKGPAGRSRMLRHASLEVRILSRRLGSRCSGPVAPKRGRDSKHRSAP